MGCDHDGVMGFGISHTEDCETAGNWRLVRRTLGVRSFGVNLVEIAPGERIPEHDETDRDQEELFYVIGGYPTLQIDGEEHPLCPGTFARVDPEHSRTLSNGKERPVSVLIVSAPRSSGYQPMEWA